MNDGIELLNIENLTQEEASKIFKAYKTLNKMMEDRGYLTDESFTKYEDWFENIKRKNSMDGIFYKIDKEDKIDQENIGEKKRIRLFYHYIPNQKLNLKIIKEFIELMKTSKANSGIMIIQGKLSQQAKQKVQDISNDLQVEIFSLNELVVNITEHELVPKHILLSKEDKELLLQRYKIKESQLPKILVSDPVARYLGLKRGDVVKIIRVSETAGRYITYRIAC